jgi:hypothetical protein
VIADGARAGTGAVHRIRLSKSAWLGVEEPRVVVARL